MKGVIIFTIVLVAIVLGHDAWISYDKDLPFALSDFGWLVNNYIPEAEPYIIDNTSESIQTDFISIVFEATTLAVVLCFMGVILAITSFFALSDKMGNISISGPKQEKSKSLLKRDRQKRTQYKRK
jgi:hypothetical protein